ncbi:hypothetical protein H6F76_14540 [Leptolyngbya sp. FACHB-321]|uniref:hypothetical protein n=1 Tax=Leptolyngbya sp. FACHB-321 TaxID=2692807 RepID=UPI00168910BB|nr:hypothetical protein [Leptolyngbya sp. FACHB-321]MBD2036233.1 hypothetical protein [Leptolyngbya sp. FACHB-321]
MSELPALSESLALPSLFTQLQVRYPTSGLLTELVQMDADRYVVRALVQLGSMTLATSMATATTVEQAEDRARLRVLALLGIYTPLSNVPAGSFGYSTPTQPLTSASQETTQLVDRFDSTTLNHSSTAAPLATVEPIAPPMSFSTLAFEPTAISSTTPMPAFEPYVADLTTAEREPELFDAPPDLDDASYNDATYEDEPYDKAPYDEEPFEEPEPIVEEAASDDHASADSSPVAEEPAAKSKPRKSSAEKAPIAESDTSSSASRDLSSLISQIGVEIDRIGWSKRQGSTYLQKTYGKKTRSELTDDELEDFLTYLNTQPSATVSS